MSGDFFDTNVLVYLMSGDADKADRVEALLAAGRPDQRPGSQRDRQRRAAQAEDEGPETREFLALLRRLLTVTPLTVETHGLGLDIAERYGLSTYDAMIAAAATLSGCERLWSQDMQHEMRIGKGLRVVNPFR